jgi:hypothetical protein
METQSMHCQLETSLKPIVLSFRGSRPRILQGLAKLENGASQPCWLALQLAKTMVNAVQLPPNTGIALSVTLDPIKFSLIQVELYPLESAFPSEDGATYAVEQSREGQETGNPG